MLAAAFLVAGVLRSQPVIWIEFINSCVSPQFLHVPLLVGPFGLSTRQKCVQPLVTLADPVFMDWRFAKFAPLFPV